MTSVLILHASSEGQAARIAERIARMLGDRGHSVDVRPARDFRAGFDAAEYEAVVIGASIHYGHHPAYLRALMRHHRADLEGLPTAFFSVSLSAGGPGAKPAAARRYLEKFLSQIGWQPKLTKIFAGALQYSKYGGFKRLLMRMIVGLAGGDTDTTRDYEYTDWNAVAGFTETFAQQLSLTDCREGPTGPSNRHGLTKARRAMTAPPG